MRILEPPIGSYNGLKGMARDLPWTINVFCFLIQRFFQAEPCSKELFRGKTLNKSWVFFMVGNMLAIFLKLNCLIVTGIMKVISGLPWSKSPDPALLGPLYPYTDEFKVIDATN